MASAQVNMKRWLRSLKLDYSSWLLDRFQSSESDLDVLVIHWHKFWRLSLIYVVIICNPTPSFLHIYYTKLLTLTEDCQISNMPHETREASRIRKPHVDRKVKFSSDYMSFYLRRKGFAVNYFNAEEHSQDCGRTFLVLG